MKNTMFRTMILAVATLAGTARVEAQANRDLGEALNAPHLPWSTDGDDIWFAQATTTHDGFLATESGQIGDNQVTWMETTVFGPGPLSFWWKVSSEEHYDFLQFYINGVRQEDRISGEVDWQLQNYMLESGPQVLRWEYAMDVSLGDGDNKGWVDQVTFGSPDGSPYIQLQPVSLTNDVGTTATFSVGVGGSEPLSFRWFKEGIPLTDGGNVAGSATPTLRINNVQEIDSAGYRLVVSNPYGSVASAVALLTVDLATNRVRLDGGFDPGADGLALALAIQPDGKIVVGGDFTILGGQPRSRIARLNADGTLDTAFDPGASLPVYCLAIQSDGKILLGGYLGVLAGETRNYLARLNSDGTLDRGFNPGPNFYVSSLVIQADGRIVLGGSFTTLGGQPRNYLARLNADGTLDTGFNPEANNTVETLAMQADGRIVLGGSFRTLGGQPRNYLARLNADGTLDTGFNPEANERVFSLAVQADGKILVGGDFTTIGGQARNGIARLGSDGLLDNGFNPEPGGVFAPTVHSLAIQADGRILVGGHFTTMGGQPRSQVARLNPDGTVDSRFDAGADGDDYPSVVSLAVQTDGMILVGGRFTTVRGQTRTNLARLKNDAPPTQSLSYEGSDITWLRGGTGPEVWRTSYAASTNTTNWSPLGEGTRISGGWRCTVSLRPEQTVRARGHIAAADNTAGWFLDAFYGKPLLISHPLSRTNALGTIATFAVAAVGSESRCTSIGSGTGCR